MTEEQNKGLAELVALSEKAYPSEWYVGMWNHGAIPLPDEQFYVAAVNWFRANLGEREPATDAVLFTPEQVRFLDEFQHSGAMHPFTCPRRDDGKHYENEIDLGVLVPTVCGWICPCCDYRQNWAHDFMLDGSAVKTHSEMFAALKGKGASRNAAPYIEALRELVELDEKDAFGDTGGAFDPARALLSPEGASQGAAPDGIEISGCHFQGENKLKPITVAESSGEFVRVPREPTEAQRHLAMMNDSPSYRKDSLTFYREMLAACPDEQKG